MDEGLRHIFNLGDLILQSGHRPLAKRSWVYNSIQLQQGSLSLRYPAITLDQWAGAGFHTATEEGFLGEPHRGGFSLRVSATGLVDRPPRRGSDNSRSEAPTLAHLESRGPRLQQPGRSLNYESDASSYGTVIRMPLGGVSLEGLGYEKNTAGCRASDLFDCVAPSFSQALACCSRTTGV